MEVNCNDNSNSLNTEEHGDTEVTEKSILYKSSWR